MAIIINIDVMLAKRKMSGLLQCPHRDSNPSFGLSQHTSMV